MQRMDSASSDELLWVNVKKPTDIKNARVMKQIRSHTQREVRRKERISRPQCVSTSRRTSKATECASVIVVKEVSNAEEQDKKSTTQEPFDQVDPRTRLQTSLQDLAMDVSRNPSPPLAVAVSSRDPVRLNQKIYRYLSLWQGERAHQLCGGDIHGRWEYWMPAIPGNDTMMYAQAFCAATHFEFWGRQNTTTDTCWLKDQAVIQVNKKIATPDFSQNDSNVAAVLCLAFASHVEDSGKDNCMAHMNGLQKIIDMRGGFEKMLPNELLSDLLAMADYLSAVIFKTPLTYTPNDDRRSDIPVYDPLNSPLISSSIFLSRPAQSEDLSGEVYRTLNSMQQLTASFENLYHSHTSPIFRSARLDDLFKSLRPPVQANSPGRSSSSLSTVPSPTKSPASLVSSSSSMSTNSSMSSLVDQHNEYIKDNLNEAIRLAGWIYYRALVRNFRFDDEANLDDARKLRDCIEATALVGWTNYPGALLWVLLVATAALRAQPEGFIVSGHLSTSTLSIGVRQWLPVRRMLEKFRLIEAMVDRNAYDAIVFQNSLTISKLSCSSDLKRKSRDDMNGDPENLLAREDPG